MNRYYTCHHESALMAKHHGLKFVSERGIPLIYDGVWRCMDCLKGGYGGDKYIVSQESLPLLEPRVGDLCWWEMSVGGQCLGEATPMLLKQGGCSEIIQRNGKAFFMPESEGK